MMDFEPSEQPSPEQCVRCGKELLDGDGRFRLRDRGVECLPCHDARIREDVQRSFK